MTQFVLQKRAAPPQAAPRAPAGKAQAKAEGAATPREAGLTSLAAGLNQAPGPAALGALHESLARPGAAKSESSRPEPARDGLPPQLQAGMERLSGLSLATVRVHYNSSHPAGIGAHAFAKGSDIHLGPGQEQHLPHEAWHVVQQAQGRAPATAQMKGGMGLNDDPALEREADVMGARALAAAGGPTVSAAPAPLGAPAGGVVQGMFRAAARFGQKAAPVMSTGLKSFSSMGGGGGKPPPNPFLLEEMRKKAEREAQVKRQFKPLPTQKPSSVFRADSSPFHSEQPGFGTHKASLSGGVLSPVDPDGETTPAQQIHGRPQFKAKSPFISSSPSLASVNPYGKHLMQVSPSPEQLLTQPELQEEIANEPNFEENGGARFDDVAHNVTQKGQPAWKPDTPQTAASAEKLGVEPDEDGHYTYRQRAQVNSDKDNETLIKGEVPGVKMFKFVPGSIFKMPSSIVPPDATYGSGEGQIDLAKKSEEQGRDPRTAHPEGFRVPLDDHGLKVFEELERGRQEARELNEQRGLDFLVKEGDITEEEAENFQSPIGKIAPRRKENL